MFSRKVILSKTSKNKKQIHNKKPALLNKNDDGFLLSLESIMPILCKDENDIELRSIHDQSVPVEGFSLQNYEKLFPNVEGKSDNKYLNVTFNEPTKCVKSKYLRLNKSIDDVEKLNRRNRKNNKFKQIMENAAIVTENKKLGGSCNKKLVVENGKLNNLSQKRSFRSGRSLKQTSLKEENEYKERLVIGNSLSMNSNSNFQTEEPCNLNNRSIKKPKYVDDQIEFDVVKEVKKSLEPELEKQYNSFGNGISNLSLVPDESMDVDDSDTLPSKNKFYLDTLKISEDALLVAFLPGSELFFCGSIWVKLLVGSISVLGYQFQEGDLYPVFSPPSHSLLNIKVLEGKNIKLFASEDLEDLQISSDWVEQLKIKENWPVTIIELRRYENNSTRLIVASKLLKNSFVQTSHDRLFEEFLGIKIVDQTKANLNPLYRESPSWNFYAETLLQSITKVPRIVVTGGKGVGKSTLFKYLMNRFLNHESVDQVACIDIDPGQPEFSLPTVLSLTKVCDPALGPAHTHMDGMNLSDQIQLVVGDINVLNVLTEYMTVVKTLKDIYMEKYSDIPLLVNTMGFTSGAGLDIMVDVIRIFNPTHVIAIESNTLENFEKPINHNFVNGTKRGILKKDDKEQNDKLVLNYDLIVCEAIARLPTRCGNMVHRELRILSYLSKLWKEEQQQLIGLNCTEAVIVPWSSLAIHVIGSHVPLEFILYAINASLVALCHVKDEYIEDVAKEVPRQIQNDSQWYSSCRCLGWGVVRGIDPITRELHILTTLSKEIVAEKINALVVTRICLPVQFSKLFCGGAVGPYMQKVKKNTNRDGQDMRKINRKKSKKHKKLLK